MSVLTPRQDEAIRTLIALWGPDRVLLVGGTALAVLTGMPWRTTLDIDLVVTVEAETCARDMAGLAGWTKDPTHEPRWVHRGATRVDLMPVTPEVLRAGELRWPASRTVMSTAGLEVVGNSAVAVALSDGPALRVAPLPMIALLKMASFLDRPHERTHDLVDFAWILHTRLPDADDRRFDPRFEGLDVRYDEGPAFVVGAELRLLAADHARLVDRFLRVVESEWLDVMAARGPASWAHDRSEVGSQLRAFAKGFRTAAP